MRVAPGATLDVLLRPAAEQAGVLSAHRDLVEALARCRLTLDPRATRPSGSALAVVGRSELYVMLAGVVDFAGERARLDKEIRRATEQIAFFEAKLGRSDFVERAPVEVVAKERERLEEQRRLLAKLLASRASIDEGRG
jgi:valyl-tRNA synthetase